MRFDFDAIFFDMDGTLIDSTLYWRLSAIEYLMGRGIVPDSEEMAKALNRSTMETLKAVFDRLGMEMDDVDGMYRKLHTYVERHFREDVRSKPGAEALLKHLSSMGKRLFVATATPTHMAKAALESTGLLKYFEAVTDIREVGIGKHEPEFYRRLAARVGVVPERCLMIEDALYSMRSAKAAGFSVAAMEDYDGPEREEITQLADAYVCDFRELLEDTEK